ncbi:hypothetical protein BCR32DRAFT_293898 [Anaeromyces robustus]|uniref:SEC7 domain-containing protein n=1 Tax=Anaeromyces robustus TaxID=1754192 RepID=A0A1Y1X3F0_9FUNG|nr:hypothetical protein BCR32DRAFT_293898 [Anaeromyces robustus]|eukprot:ORX80331.1 hypothetical protein BCR32DRAFT_293898 [Anaeromyces robustus]
MKKLAYKNEDLIQQVQNYLNKILAETGSKQKKLRESINSTLDVLKEDLESLQSSQKANEQVAQEPTEIKNNEENKTESEQQSNNIEKQDEIIEVNKNETTENNESDDTKENDKQDEITENNISEVSETKNNNTVLIGAEKYWEPFKLACNSKNPVKIREIALDALQYLISHRMLTGSTPLDINQEPVNTPNLTSGIIKDIKGPENDESSVSVVSESEPTTPVDKPNNNNTNNNNNKHPQYPSPAFLIDEIIHVICSSFTLAPADDSVQLKVLKALLTSITSTSCEVHHVTLLKLIQSCFNIYIFSKNNNNQITAKAVLTQMINLVFSRMERYSYVLSKHIENGTLLKLSKSTPLREVVEQFSDFSKDSQSQSNQTSNSNIPNSSTETTDSIVDKATLPNTSSSNIDSENGENNENEKNQSNNNGNDNPTTTDENSKKISTKMHIKTHSKSYSISSVSTNLNRNPYDPTIAYYNELLRKDVFLVFRLLCQLSLFKDNGQAVSFNNSTVNNSQPAAADLSPTSIRARTIALELILSILTNSGPVFQTDPLYSDMVKNYLCISISKNGISENPLIFELSLSIFIMMLRFYKAPLKAEIEVILNTIYLHILDMGSSSFLQKKKLLEGLLKVCENPQTLVDIYLNYDCDLNLESVFEKLINSCARIAQGHGLKKNNKSSNQNDISVQQETELRICGTKCLVSIINSMVEWTKELQPNGNVGDFPNDLNINTMEDEVNENASEGTLNNMKEKKRNSNVSSAASSTVNLTALKQDDIKSTTTGDMQKNNSFSNLSTYSNSNNSASFRDALLPQNQIHNVLIYKNPLGSVSLNDINRQASPQPTTSNATSDALNAKFEEVLSKKHALSKGINLFNIRPKKGIEFLIKEGFLTRDLDTISQFLHNTSGLNKTAIGEYLGEGDDFNIQLMHKFVDAMDFYNLPFVDAIRKFLQAFRLPGESQKIDRLMEKFADRYCENNPNVFANADTAYTLAFSVIMLNTDQHSSQIKNRMEKADFIKNNRGINNNADLPDEFLSEIFDEIANNEIVMEEEQASQIAKIAKGQLLTEQERKELYYKEMEKVQKLSQELIKGGSHNKRSVDKYKIATQREIVKPMFSASWCPIMATLSLIFEDIDYDYENISDVNKKREDNDTLSELCLLGISGSIRIASIFNMVIERNAFISTLTKMTGLFNIDLSSIRPKNIKAIEILIQLAATNGECFDDNWYDFFICLSQLEKIEYLYRRQNPDKTSDHNNNDTTSTSAPSSPNVSETIIPKTIYMDQLFEKIQSQAFVILIDKIFSNTILLSGTEIVQFCKCLCDVSLEEVQLNEKPSRMSASISSSSPRMYSLQKIVEITYYNMDRIRLEFAKIWNIIQQHFIMVGCHSDKNVSSFAIDSLRQLTMKYFERSELTHYQTQNEFLKCFDSIMRKTESPAIKEMIIQSMQHIVSLQVDNIRSGWKGIFTVLSRPAQINNSLSILEKSFNLMQSIYRNYSDKIISSGSFVSFVTSLKDFLLIDQTTPVGERIIINTFSLLQDCVNQISAANAIKNKGISLDSNASLPIITSLISTATPPKFDNNNNNKESLLTTTDTNKTDIDSKTTNTDTTNNTDNNNKTTDNVNDNNKPSVLFEEPEKETKTIKALLQISTEDQYYLMWFPILSTYSQILIRSNNSTVKNRALSSLFDTLEHLASTLLDSKFWKNIQRSVIFPIFEDLMEHDENDPTNPFDSEMMVASVENLKNSKMHPLKMQNGNNNETNPNYSSSALWTNAFLRLLDLFKHYIPNFSEHPYLINGFLDLIVSLIQKPRDELQNMGVTFLQQFLEENVEKIRGDDIWEIVTSTIEKCFNSTVPDIEAYSNNKTINLGHKPGNNRETQKKTMEQIAARYIVHLRLLQEIHKFSNIMVPHRLDSEGEGAFIDEKHKSMIFDHLNRSNNNNNNINNNSNSNNVNDNNNNDDDNNDNINSNNNNNEVPMISVIPIHFQERWLNLFYHSYKSSHSLNETKILQQSSYQQQGITEQIPLLIEVISFSSYLQLLFSIYSVYGDSRSNSNEIINEKLIPMCMMILKSFVSSELESKYQNKILTIVIMIYKELMKIPGWQHPEGSNRKLTLKDSDNSPSSSIIYLISNENISSTHDTPLTPISPIVSNNNTDNDTTTNNNNNTNNNTTNSNNTNTTTNDISTTTNTSTSNNNNNNNNNNEIDYPELWDGIRKEIPNFFKYSIPIVQIISQSRNVSNNPNYATQLSDLSHTIKEFYEVVACNFM